MATLEIRVPMRWSDLDGYQHVNNAAFLRILEEARIQALWAPPPEQSEPSAPSPLAVANISPGGAYHTFVVSHRIEYMRQLGYRRDGVIVRLWISRLGGASIDIDYEIVTADEPDAPYTRARTVVVLVDSDGGRPARIPTSLRDACEPYREEPLRFRG